MYVEHIRNFISENYSSDSIVLNIPAFDKSIVGITTDNRVIYDYDKMIKELSADAKITEEEAEDFINYNTIGSLNNIEECKRPIIMISMEASRNNV